MDGKWFRRVNLKTKCVRSAQFLARVRGERDRYKIEDEDSGRRVAAMFGEWVIKSVADAASRKLKAGSRYVSGMGYKK